LCGGSCFPDKWWGRTCSMDVGINSLHFGQRCWSFANAASSASAREACLNAFTPRLLICFGVVSWSCNGHDSCLLAVRWGFAIGIVASLRAGACARRLTRCVRRIGDFICSRVMAGATCLEVDTFVVVNFCVCTAHPVVLAMRKTIYTMQTRRTGHWILCHHILPNT